MAVQFTPKHSRTSEYRFYPDDITIKPALNGRHVLPDIEWLVQDIKVNGQHTPVVIRNDGGKPVLCAGFSRWRAVAEINKTRKGDERLHAALAKLTQEQQAAQLDKADKDGKVNSAPKPTLKYKLAHAVETGEMWVNGQGVAIPSRVLEWLRELIAKPAK